LASGLICEKPPLPVIQCFGKLATNPEVCNKNGACTATDTCTCNPGYLDAQCDNWKCKEIFKNQTTVCNEKGTCSAPNICACITGFRNTTGGGCQSGSVTSMLSILAVIMSILAMMN
jgi:hypothetical protein